MTQFPQSVRLRKRGEFERTTRHGTRLTGKKLVVEALLSAPNTPPKLGITVTKKFGKAHDRNRFKRCVREAFRLSLNLLPKGVWLNVRPRHKDVVPTTVAFQEELLFLVKIPASS